MQLSLPVPAHACDLDRSDLASNRPSSSDTGIQVRRAGSRSPPGTGHLELWRNAPEPRPQPGLTFNRMQQNILFRPYPQIKNKPFFVRIKITFEIIFVKIISESSASVFVFVST
ncbi:UNVERIFIED_ORG: hypothetical protein ABIB63_002550 [Xanthomonas axonopodis]